MALGAAPTHHRFRDRIAPDQAARRGPERRRPAALRGTARGVAPRRGSASSTRRRASWPVPSTSLAADRSAEARLAGLLALLARAVGARRAAVLADGIERRVAVAVIDTEDEAAAAGPRGLARRDGAALALRSAPPRRRPPSSLASQALPAPDGRTGRARPSRTSIGTYALDRAARRPAGTVLGFDFPDADGGRGPARAPAAGDGPPRRASPSSLVTTQLAARARARDAPGTGRRAGTLRVHGRPRAAHAADRPQRLSRPDPRRAGRGRRRPSASSSTGAGSSSTSMAELVGDLLELSRLESGTLGLELRPVLGRGARDAGRPTASIRSRWNAGSR